MPTKANLLPEAIKILEIDVPVMRYERKGNTITLWLYGRSKPVKWTRPARRRTKKESA